MKKKRKGQKKLSTGTLLARYRDPLKPGSLGGLTRFAKANKITVRRAREVLERGLGYTLHKPRRRRFLTAPVLVVGIDEQWTADLIEVINIAKYNRGYRYLLTVVDVFSKHAWVQPVKNKTGQAVTAAFEKILKEGRKPINLQTDDGKEFYNKTFQSVDETERDSSFFDQRGYESQCRGTVQSNPETTFVPVLYGEEHPEFRTGVARSGARVQSFVPSQYQEGPERGDRNQ